MTLIIGTSARNAAVDGVTALLNAGGAGRVEVYTGSQPADPATAASGTLLATVTLSATAYAAAASGTASLNTAAAATAVATGTAGWFRAKSGAGTAIFDGAVGTVGAELNLNSTTITTGGTVTITAGTFSMPAS